MYFYLDIYFYFYTFTMFKMGYVPFFSLFSIALLNKTFDIDLKYNIILFTFADLHEIWSENRE